MNATLTPEASRSWNSMEGVPDWADVPAPLRPVPKTEPKPEAVEGNFVRRTLYRLGEYLPGVCLGAGVAWLAEAAAKWVGTSVLGYAKSPISGVPVAILFGLFLCNTIGVPTLYRPGLRLCATTLLRTAIVLLGLRLSLFVAASIGWQALPVVALCVGGALLLVPWFGERAGLPRRLAALIAVGTGICGVTAILATAPTIEAEEDEVSYAVACIAIFGMIAMLLHPLIAHLIFGPDARSAGIFLGTAIHDTSQVAGAGLTFAARYQMPDALNVATVTKLMRNLCLAGAIPFMAWRYAAATKASGGTTRKTSWHTMFPLFVLGFVAMTIVRTIGDRGGDHPFGFLQLDQWKAILGYGESFSAIAITIVMAAVGSQTDFKRFRRLGLRPLFVGFAAAVVVGLVSVTTVFITRNFFHS